jgi:hypothetical protein
MICYGDLWKLLRRRGYDCYLLGTNPRGNHNTVRICQHPSGSQVTLADYPPDQVVRDEILFIVKIELDNFGLMTREEFDRWVKRRAKANAATNGTPVKSKGSGIPSHKVQ